MGHEMSFEVEMFRAFELEKVEAAKAMAEDAANSQLGQDLARARLVLARQ